MPITYQFEVPQAPIPDQYRYYDGMRGLSGLGGWRGPNGVAGGIFRTQGHLHGLGDATADATAVAIEDFGKRSLPVRNDVAVASAQMLIHGGPIAFATFQNNTAHLDSIAAQVKQGNIGKIAAWTQLAREMVRQAKEAAAESWWQNLPDIEEAIAIIEAIPAKFAAAIVATAGVTGQAAGDLLRNAGIDPGKIVDTAGTTAKWIGLGAVALAAIYLVSR